jgi:hypothetical protein
MFKLLGADGKEYGPVTEAQVRQWIAENRANHETRAKREGEADWKPLSAFVEFSPLFAAPPLAPPPAVASTGSTLPPDLMQRPVRVSIGDCLNRGFSLLSNNFGAALGGCAVIIAIEFFVSLLGFIPILGPLISLATIFVNGPLMGGLYYYMLKVIRGQPTDVGEVFAGFRLCFLQLMLAYLVITVLCGVASIPGGAMVAIGVIAAIAASEPTAFHLLLMGLGLVIVMVPLIYLGTAWMFTLPLVIDKQLEFWPAMETSRKLVNRCWWRMFFLMILCGLINLVGVLLCCVGTFFTMPIAFGAMMYAYEDLFGAAQRPAA